MDAALERPRDRLAGLRWPWNYVVFGGFFGGAATGMLAWGLAAPGPLGAWVDVAAVAGACAGLLDAYWRVRTRGGVLVLDSQVARAAQAQPPDYSTARTVGYLLAGALAFFTAGRPILYAGAGAFCSVALAVRIVSSVRHRAQLRLLANERLAAGTAARRATAAP